MSNSTLPFHFSKHSCVKDYISPNSTNKTIASLLIEVLLSVLLIYLPIQKVTKAVIQSVMNERYK